MGETAAKELFKLINKKQNILSDDNNVVLKSWLIKDDLPPGIDHLFRDDLHFTTVLKQIMRYKISFDCFSVHLNRLEIPAFARSC